MGMGVGRSERIIVSRAPPGPYREWPSAPKRDPQRDALAARSWDARFRRRRFGKAKAISFGGARPRQRGRKCPRCSCPWPAHSGERHPCVRQASPVSVPGEGNLAISSEARTSRSKAGASGCARRRKPLRAGSSWISISSSMCRSMTSIGLIGSGIPGFLSPRGRAGGEILGEYRYARSAGDCKSNRPAANLSL